MAKNIVTAKELRRILVEIDDQKDQFDRVYVFFLSLEKRIERLLDDVERGRSGSSHPALGDANPYDGTPF
jgi:hypothetical protein